MSIKQLLAVRALVISDVDKMSRHLHVMLSMLSPTESDAMRALEGSQRTSFVVSVTECVLQQFGQKPSVAAPRFNKTHRQANQLIRKELVRGEPRQRVSHDSTPTLEEPR
jgi:hypothetical protein